MIKVAVWGTGMMGQGLLGYILDRPNQIDLVGVIDRHPEKHGRTVGETIGCDCDIPVTADFASVLAKKPDVVCILTASNLHEIADQVTAAVEAGANVIGIAETLAYPVASDPEWTAEFDALAKKHGVSILGTGINPGFVLDALPIAMSSICLQDRQDRGHARQRPGAVRPHGHGVAGRGHHRRAVRGRRRRRQHRRATSASTSRSA